MEQNCRRQEWSLCLQNVEPIHSDVHLHWFGFGHHHWHCCHTQIRGYWLKNCHSWSDTKRPVREMPMDTCVPYRNLHRLLLHAAVLLLLLLQYQYQYQCECPYEGGLHSEVTRKYQYLLLQIPTHSLHSSQCLNVKLLFQSLWQPQ